MNTSGLAASARNPLFRNDDSCLGFRLETAVAMREGEDSPGIES